VDLNTRTAQHMNIAEEIARKVEMNYVFGHESQELVQRSSEDSFREIGKPSTPTFNPIETDALADYALPFIYSGGIWRLTCSLSPYQTRGGRRPLLSALPNTLLRSCAEISVHAYSQRMVAHGLQLRFARRIQNMKFRSLVCVLMLALGPLGLAQDVATEVGKGVKDIGKAAKTTTKEVAHGTERAAKDVAHSTDKAATASAKGTKKASRKTARVGRRAGKKTGNEIGKGAEDAGKGTKEAAIKTADALK
jgi:hypothetical protein